jgi:hypothetical protein
MYTQGRKTCCYVRVIYTYCDSIPRTYPLFRRIFRPYTISCYPVDKRRHLRHLGLLMYNAHANFFLCLSTTPWKHNRSGSIAPSIHYYVFRWGYEVSFMCRFLQPLQRAVGTHWLGGGWVPMPVRAPCNTEKSLLLTVLEHRPLSCPARSLVTILKGTSAPVFTRTYGKAAPVEIVGSNPTGAWTFVWCECCVCC